MKADLDRLMEERGLDAALVAGNEILANRGYGIRLSGTADTASSRNLIVRNQIQGNLVGLRFETNAVNNTIRPNTNQEKRRQRRKSGGVVFSL